MKRIIIVFIAIIISSLSVFSQTSEGDIALIQQYFGVQKTALLQDYMKFSPKQDSAFWTIYNAYEQERLLLGKQRVKLVDEYLNSVKNLTEANANSLVDRQVALEIGFKNLQKKYFSKISKAVGPVKAAQWFQFENYINNVANLSIQESIPFIGDLEQKHDKMPKKK